jgi:Holliday junction resolvasome RuvABC endonuclease subunit
MLRDEWLTQRTEERDALRSELARVTAVVDELLAAEAAHEAALNDAFKNGTEWLTFASGQTRFARLMAPCNARVDAARAALVALRGGVS